MPRELAQNATAYIPSGYLTDTSVPRVFYGSIAPDKITGITLAVGDIWSATTTVFGYGSGGYGANPYGA